MTEGSKGEWRSDGVEDGALQKSDEERRWRNPTGDDGRGRSRLQRAPSTVVGMERAIGGSIEVEMGGSEGGLNGRFENARLTAPSDVMVPIQFGSVQL